MILRPYQIEIAEQAVRLLLQYNIAYLCMQVRVGKTLTAFHTATLYGVKDVLFVTKLKAISSIQADYNLFDGTFAIDIINYEQLHNYTGNPDLIILDEAHCLSQYPKPAERTKALKEICAGKPIIYLSGTPTPESFAQLYHQFWVSSYSPFTEENFYKWHKAWGIPKVKYMYNRQIADYSKTKDITDQYKHLMITYTQEEAGFIAPVEEEILYVPMSDKIAWAVNKIRRDKIFTTKDGKVILGDTAVKEMQKVHQLCSGTVKAECGEGIVFDNTKALFIKERFKGLKIAIFYKYIAEYAQLKWDFVGRLVTDPMEFEQAGPDKIFVSQIQSGREGINLSTADCLVMYNIDFSAVSYWQARARIQNKDRQSAAKVYWVFCKGGIEEKIYQVVQGKKDFTLSHYRKLPL